MPKSKKVAKLKGKISSLKFPKKIISDGSSTNRTPKGFKTGY